MPDDGAVAVQNNAPAVAPGGADGQPAAAPGGDMWGMIKSMLYRLMIIYFVTSFIRNWRQPAPVENRTDITGGPGGGAQRPSRNLFPQFTEVDVYIYLSEIETKFADFNDSRALFGHFQNIKYGDWKSGANGDGTYEISGEFPTSENLQNNGSIFMHVFVTKSGNSPDPNVKSTYSKRYTIYRSRRLNKYKKKKYQKTANLLTGKTEQSEEDMKKAEVMTTEILSHWHPNLTINLVDDQTNWVRGTLPAPLDEFVEFDPITGDYYPIFFFNDYWNLMSDYQPINSSVKSLNLTIVFSPISLFKWQMYAAQTMRNRWTSMLGQGASLFEEADEDQDSLKQAMLDTNPYLLGMTIVVSILHTIFEFMAFKNDIQFWRNRKSLEGLSVRSVIFNVFTSGIVFLYILDNETNFVVRMSVGIGILIELWKIPKCMDVSIDYERKWLGIIPRLVIKDKGSYVSMTKQYDMMAFKYLSWALYPLLVGYAIYSLLYQEHRGWYSWVLSMLYGFLLTFGFIMMTPQLFINYKLKSVAHLPWRMLSYKFLNTFIDDIFAFVIKMPTMYRIGCFRDDIVFLIYVYQRWIYRVDPKRMNEFGTSGEMETNPTAVPIADGEAGSALAADTTPSINAPDSEPTAAETDSSNHHSSPDNSPSKKSSKKKKESKKTQ
jgi:hypothetical protein